MSGFWLVGYCRLAMTPDCELLRRYAEAGAEEAFAELVRRHLPLVYSAALRQVNGDAHLAQDVAQATFTELARKASSLCDRQVLIGWLYTTTHFVAVKTVRAARRRHRREQEAHAMQELLNVPELGFDWETIRPVLDQVMHELNEPDREVILMRYFENRQLAEIGERMDLSEDAARKRVERSLEKLRTFLSKRGITATASMLAALSTNAVQLAPAGLAEVITSGSLAGAGTGTTLTILKLMSMTKLKIGIIAALVVAAGTTPLVLEHQARARLREKDERLRHDAEQLALLTAENQHFSEQLAKQNLQRSPRLPAPPMRATISRGEPPPEDPQSINRMAQILNSEKPPQLTPAQVESYLKENRRSAASLLAAFRATGDPALLQEAMDKHPNDPRVDFAAIHKPDASPEERRRWLDAFKQSAPDNALANYLSALDYFKSGRTDQAVQELSVAAGKKQFQDYTMDSVQNSEEAYRAAGYSVAETKTIAATALLLPQLGELKQLSQNMMELANAYRQAGDDASAQTAVQMVFSLGQRFDGSQGEALVSQLFGMALQSLALRGMDPTSPYGSTGQTVQGRLDELTQQRTKVKDLADQLGTIQGMISAQDWISYADRSRAFGEDAALRWVISKYGKQ
ncbi:MAG TPA: sigma-70 family RNA polymerase sigma factor [Candidatus Acidoferrum sp.]|jgi:RNA polymerase sigma factor (sigma-70 family)|nr:sigma-70 family RNA polymerase sigma factor [Candidatus Acidoferrum sp.]